MQVGIAHGGLVVGMTQDATHREQINPSLDHSGGRCVPHVMEPESFQPRSISRRLPCVLDRHERLTGFRVRHDIWAAAKAGRRLQHVNRCSPNTLRHTCSTELHRRGVPEAQIDTAAGHSDDSTNKRHYRHLRPEYLSDFIGAVEDYWGEMAKLTTAHLRYQRDTKIFDFGAARVKGAPKNG